MNTQQSKAPSENESANTVELILPSPSPTTATAPAEKPVPRAVGTEPPVMFQEDNPSMAVLQREYSIKELGLLAMLERRQIDPHYGGMTLKVLREGKRDAELAAWIKNEIPDEKLARMHIIKWCVDNGYITAAPTLPKKSIKNSNPVRKIKKLEQ